MSRIRRKFLFDALLRVGWGGAPLNFGRLKITGKSTAVYVHGFSFRFSRAACGLVRWIFGLVFRYAIIIRR